MAAPGNDMDLGHNDAVGDAILGPDGNPLHPLLLEVSAAEMQAEVDVIAQPLVAAHFPAGIFDVPRAIAAGHSFKNFKKLVKNVAILHEQGILPGAVASGTRKGIWDLHTDATLAQFVKFSRFVTAKEGQDLVYGLQRKRKIEEKAQPGQTPEQLHLVEILDVQRQKYSNTRKKIRVECEKEIDELQMQLRLKRKEMGDKLNALDAEYYPASAFEEPNEEEIGALSLQMYEVECQRTGRRPAYLPGGKTEYARKHYGAKARSNLMYEFATREEYKAPLVKFLAQEILNFVPGQMRPPRGSLGIPWLQSVGNRLLMWPLRERQQRAALLPVGLLADPQANVSCRPLSGMLPRDLLERRLQRGAAFAPDLARSLEIVRRPLSSMKNLRLAVLQEGGEDTPRQIPVSRSKFEAAIRKIIGGGALSTWERDKEMYRGGGNTADALLLLSTACEKLPGAFLKDRFGLFSARLALGLPDDFPVPDGRQCCVMKNFNNDATAGPFLRRFGINSKRGLKRILEDEMWQYYDDFASGRVSSSCLPYFCARLGFRTKLLDKEKALRRIKEQKAFGRAVMMMDALEQAASTPLYNVVSQYAFSRRLERDFGFKNSVIRASSDWPKIWSHVREAKAVVELDWSKFDRERPSEDLLFIVDVVCSCFRPKNEREKRLLKAYKIMMKSALVDRVIVLDSDGALHIDGMVPSGSLWTGFIDTALNILYIKSACTVLGIPSCDFSPMCAGDDNLTLFWRDPGRKLDELRVILNRDYRAGIDREDYLIHRGKFYVTKRQATFPKNLNLKEGTSKLMKYVKWVEFEGELIVNEAEGMSHRWEYHFRGCPKFLSFYWLPDGRPIRPSHDNLEKLLWPEGLHTSMGDYMAAVASMAVDNPYNHHNINHLLMRFIICSQIMHSSAGWMKPQETMWFAKIKAKEGEEVPFPMVAPWRRQKKHARMEDYTEVHDLMTEFRDFVAGITSLYVRDPSGGLDAYHYMDLIRGDSRVGDGQYGNDLVDWLDWLHRHPVTKYFRAARGFRAAPGEVTLDREDQLPALRCFKIMREKLYSKGWSSCKDFALFLCNECRDLG
ncbi:TPA_asm: fusion protein [Chionochloa macra amalgavirus 1]|nr:TPA_asm: fusion protein [Chionochloa macra amalgavirus 1]